MLQLKNLSVYYPEEHNPAVQDINLSFEEGEIVLFAGPNGSGKSTLMKAIIGVIPHIVEGVVHGEILLKGESIRHYSTAQLAGKLGIILQDPESQISNLTVEDEVCFGPANLHMPASVIRQQAEESLKQMNIDHLKRVSVLALSGGQMQRLTIASLLAMNPEILILDEPITNLDPLGVVAVVEKISLLKKHVKLVLISSHWLDPFLMFSSRIVILDHGQIVIDSDVQEIRRKATELSQWGVQIPQVWQLENVLAQLTNNDQQIVLKPHTTHLKASTSACELREVSYRFKESSHTTLTSLNLTIGAGERTAFVGHNGQGKTTLARIIAGLIKPTSGKLIGKPKSISLMFQKPTLGFFCNTVGQEISFSSRMNNQELGNLLAEFSLQEYIDRSPYQLSGGEQRRLALAVALSSKPDFLILDESTAGLDSTQVEVFLRLLDLYTGTVIHITHDTRIVGNCVDTITVLGNGSVLFTGQPCEASGDILRYLGYDKVNPTVQFALEQLQIGIPFLPEQVEVY